MQITEKRCLKCLKDACIDRVMEEFYPWALLEDTVLIDKVAKNISKSIVTTTKQQLLDSIIQRLCDTILQKEIDYIVKSVVKQCSIKILSEIKLEVTAKCKKLLK